MRGARTFIAVAALSALAQARAEPGWAYVPASRRDRTLGTIDGPYIPIENAVNFVGPHSSDAAPQSGQRHVFTFELAVHAGAQVDGYSLGRSEADTMPDGTLWPDASGRIIAAAGGKGGGPKTSGIKNPWEVRIHPRSAGNDTEFFCGGIISGGGPITVAIVNGRIVRKGDALGKFSVARILNVGVVLENAGLQFVLPMGRRTTVTIVGG